MPRPKKTVATSKKHYTKKEKNSRLEAEKKLKLDREGLKVPSWLENDLIAREEFIRVVDEAGKIDLLDNLDLAIITIYCNAYSSFVDVTKRINENGRTVQGKDGEKSSPYVTQQNKYVEQILKCSSKLGLATTDRLKLIIPSNGNEKENKYAKYIVM